MANDRKLWTTQERTLAWQTYLDTPNGTGLWGRMSRLLNKSVKACQTEIWKLHRSDLSSGVRYWAAPERSEMCLEGRSGQPWTVNEKTALINSMKSKLPIERLCELFGRDPDEILDKYQGMTNKGRRPFGLRG